MTKKIATHAYTLLSYCIGVWGGGSQCTSRCDGLMRIHKKLVKKLFSKFFQNNIWFFRQAIVLKRGHIYKLNVASNMFNILKDGKYPTLTSSFYMLHPRYSYHTWNSNDMSLPYPRVEGIMMNYQYHFIKVWLVIPWTIKRKRSYTTFKSALTEFYSSQYWNKHCTWRSGREVYIQTICALLNVYW